MRILFGTIMRNIEASMMYVVDVCCQIAQQLPDSHIFIYENNSDDITRAYFPLLQTLNQNIHIQSETLVMAEQLELCKARTWDNKPCRMELIAAARNKLLKMLDTFGVQDDDYVVMFDADMDAPLNIQQIVMRIQTFPQDVDAIFANGMNRNRRTYYDLYAYRDRENLYGPEIIGDSFWNNMKSFEVTTHRQILSGFGGLAIYRGRCMKDNSYSAVPTADLDALYKSLGTKTGRPTLKHNGVLLGMYLFGTGPFADGVSINPNDIFYVNNSGYNFPVVCEHSTFHARLTMRGQGTFLLDPSLHYFSTH